MFFVGPVCSQFKNDLLGELSSEVDSECTNTGGGTVVAAVYIVLGIEMTEDDLVTEVDDLSSFFIDDGFKLVFFCLCAGGRLCFFELILLRVHLVIDFEGPFWQYFEQGLAIVVDVDDIASSRRKEIFLVVYLKIKVGIGVAMCGRRYDLLVRKVLGLSRARILMICP